MLIVLCNKESSIDCDLAASFSFQTVIRLAAPHAGIEGEIIRLERDETFSNKDIVGVLHLTSSHDVVSQPEKHRKGGLDVGKYGRNRKLNPPMDFTSNILPDSSACSFRCDAL